MGKIDDRLEELGIVLPNTVDPVANYVSAKRVGNMIYMSGAAPFVNGKPAKMGKLGAEVTKEEGYEAARICAINLLTSLKNIIGDLDKVSDVVKVFGLVASAEDFYGQPAVINGASDLFVKVFGEKGRHARSAVGTNVLPLNIPVEVEAIFAVEE